VLVLLHQYLITLLNDRPPLNRCNLGSQAVFTVKTLTLAGIRQAMTDQTIESVVLIVDKRSFRLSGHWGDSDSPGLGNVLDCRFFCLDTPLAELLGSTHPSKKITTLAKSRFNANAALSARNFPCK
jgi:hypothetical protein